MRDALFIPDVAVESVTRPADGPVMLSTSVREVRAEHTLALIRPIVEQFGVRQVIDLTLRGVPSCPVFQVTRADMRSDYFNAGKGFSRVESMVSGLMEAIEVQCFEHAAPALLHRRDLVEAQRGRILAARELVPDAPTCTGHLVRGLDHANQQAVWLPADIAFREVETGNLTSASCNGIASGNSMEDALCHALCELAERHALEEFYRRGPSMPLERVTPPPGIVVMAQCLAELRSQEISAEFLLISSAIPVFICFLDIPLNNGHRGVVQGYGAHIKPEIAMCRALAEAVQMLALCPTETATPQGAAAVGDDAQVIMTSKQSATLAPELIARQRNADHAMLGQLRERVELVDYEYSAAHDIEMDGEGATDPRSALQFILDRLAGMGYPHVVSCVISPPTLPVVVVKAFCRGLKSIPGL